MSGKGVFVTVRNFDIVCPTEVNGVINRIIGDYVFNVFGKGFGKFGIVGKEVFCGVNFCPVCKSSIDDALCFSFDFSFLFFLYFYKNYLSLNCI